MTCDTNACMHSGWGFFLGGRGGRASTVEIEQRSMVILAAILGTRAKGKLAREKNEEERRGERKRGENPSHFFLFFPPKSSRYAGYGKRRQTLFSRNT